MTWGFLKTLIQTNLRASTALRGAFLMQCVFMLFNNLIFFVTWWIFFKNFKEIGGWTFAEITLLYGIVSGSFGIAMIFGGGVRQLARLITEGELDSFLTQPKNLLIHIAGSRSIASGWGDIISMIVLIAYSGYLKVENLPILLGVLLSGALLFVCAGIIFNSLAFFLGHMDNLARQLFEFVVTFSVYPQTVYTGYFKLLLFTLIPAGFIGYLPVELLRAFTWPHLAALIGGTLLYTSFAIAFFFLGLRFYTSGNRMT